MWVNGRITARSRGSFAQSYAMCLLKWRAVLTSTVTGSDLETRAEIPIRRACCSAKRSPKALYIIRLTPGIKRFRTRAASRPFITGIDKSKITRSGRSCWAFVIASLPSRASPHTRKPGSRTKTPQRACRIEALSSTMRTDVSNENPASERSRREHEMAGGG